MIAASDYEFLRKYLKDRSGLALSDEKQYLLVGRLDPIAKRYNLAGLPALVGALRNAPSGPIGDAVVDAMTTNESLFFRDKRPFELLSSSMLPTLVRSRPAGRPLRIWCAASSTGQEPYSIAMTLQENAAILGGRKVEIVATDLSTEVLERAQSGIYNQFEVQRGLPINHMLKYFSKVGDQWQVSPALRAMVSFRKLNLLHPFFGLGTFDIVFCRNVLIYFDAPTKGDVLERIAAITAPDGYLFLGGAETVLGLTDAFVSAPERGYYVRNTQARAATA
jgi:chemotaxis protein methyltransferase CheR